MVTWGAGELNPEQKAAILQPRSVFLTACPGSGKTRTLTHKIAFELSRMQSSKQFVVAITYTHRAADTIHARVERLGVDTAQLWIGTIHSFCLEWILKPYSVYHTAISRGFRVIDSHEREQLLSELCKPYTNPKVTHWECEFHFDEEGYVLSCSKDWKHDSLYSVIDQYLEILRERRQIDFELILYYAHQLLTDHPSISSLLARLFPFVLVDEYQDTKQIQYAIIASILKAGQGATRTFIVGDPNQGIYESFGGYPIAFDVFRGMAGIDMIELRLSKNYRSSERIVEYFSNYGVHDTLIEAASDDKNYPSLVSFNDTVTRADLQAEIVRLIRFNIEVKGVAPHEVCVLAPQWVYLASMTRHLVAAMPEYQFDGPGMVPFARDIDNFWYKISRVALTQASPGMYVRRLRWAGEIIKDLAGNHIDVSALTMRSLLRECNSIQVAETDGLCYLHAFFDILFSKLDIDLLNCPAMRAHHAAFFTSSQARIARLKKDGAECIGDIESFRRVFRHRTGIVISTIHGIKGAEFDAVIAYALLEKMVPHFSDPKGQESAKKLLYVIGSRARKNLHLLSERERQDIFGNEYEATCQLAGYSFSYDIVP